MNGHRSNRRSGRRRVAAALAAVAGGLLLPVPARATLDARERARIERLIEHVGRQSQIRFIRGGTDYDARQAAEHLQMKFERAAPRLQNVDEFIDHVASRSWLTGKPYRVRLPDGREVAASAWLRGELARIEGGAQAPR